jgi:hypothetical protein
MVTVQESSVASFSYEIQSVSSCVEGSAASQALSTGRTSSQKTAKPVQYPGTKTRIKRKISGFLRYLEGTRARVVFDDGNGEPVEYYLSADLLKENGVTVPQQPFELIEAVRFFSETESEHFTKITPLALASSAQIETLDLPEETRNNIQYVLGKLKAKS